MPRSNATEKSKGLSRNEWLARALEVLAKEGSSVMTVDALVKRLNVTRGSFYWHFEDRADFIRQLVHYWSVAFTEEIAKEVSKVRGGAAE